MDVGAKSWLVAAALLGAPGSATAECPAAGPAQVRIAAVEPRLELRLDDGRLLRLAGLDPAAQTPNDPDLGETAHQRLAAMVTGRSVSALLLANSPDRWGRLPALVFATGQVSGGGLAAAVIAMGLGRYLAEPAAHACRAEFLSAEAAARGAKLGLWADPYYSVLAANDQAAFSERSATMVVMEGRLGAVEPGPYRTQLRFEVPGSHGRHLLSVSILPRVMKTFEAQGVTFQPLIGSTLRVRGLLDLRFGPQIEAAGPDDLEVVAGPAH